MPTKKTTTKQPASAKPKRAKKAKGDPKRLSALDAAAKVLSGAGEPKTTRELVEVMAAKGFWASPKGKTPAATLYSAIMREINTKGKAARFKKVERGKFALA